ncbi:MAG: IPExxxVDY family protein [Bacteroidales bacterium]|nr:IPExxxVDY family protein [Bacteroidales bacterium]
MSKKTIEQNINTNFEIIGIISSQKDYKLAWFLNEKTDLKLAKSTNNFLPENFSFYKSASDIKIFILIENKNSEGVLFSELKKFNYILKIFDVKYFENTIKDALSETSEIIISGYLSKDKLAKKTLKIISEIEI